MEATRGTVLIVDDDPGVTRTFARILALQGYDVLTALDGQSGLRQTAATKPDAILLDLRMPLMDGIMFLRRLRDTEHDNHARHTPVAIVTGDYLVDDALTNQIAALDAILCFKPLWLDDLLALAQRLIVPCVEEPR